jgi:diguanylate cyclase (GGDEF)-like protein/PAS domain S-box-containing protein
METHRLTKSVDNTGTLTKEESLERQLNQIQRIAHVGVWEFLPASNKLLWSDETCRIFGIDKTHFDGTLDSYLSAVHPEDRGKVLASIERAGHEGIHLVTEHRIIRPGGELRHLLVTGYSYRSENGMAVVCGTVQDITDRQRTNEALENVSAMLYRALERMSDAFYMLDRDWRFTYLNREAERFLRRSREDLIGKVLWNEFPDLHGTRFESELRQAMERNLPANFEELYHPFEAWKALRVFPSADGLAVYFTDITEQKRAQEIERQNTERFKIIVRATTDVIWEWDVSTDSLWWSEGVRSVFGYSPDEVSTSIQMWEDRIHPEERDRIRQSFFTATKTQQEAWSGEYRFLRKDGSYAYVRDRCVILRNDSGTVKHVIGSVVDITEQKQAEARNRIQASLLDKAQDAILVTGIDDRISYWNGGAERLFGWTAAEAIGKTKAELIVADLEKFHEAVQTLLQQGDWVGELSKRSKNGRTFIVESHWTMVRDDNGKPQSILAIETDITQRKQAALEIENLAFFDPLTGLPNRRLLLDRLRHALAVASRNGHAGALLFLDLDNFKRLNDTLGHDKGDLLLQQVAQRLRACAPRASDTIARHGGDEFVLILEDLNQNLEEAAAQTERVAEKILAAFDAPFQLNDHQHHSTPSIGVALFDKHIGSLDELLKRADMAMYQAKAMGRNTIRFYDPEMQTVINTRVQLEADFRRGLRRQEFRLHYQRQTDGKGRTIGAEALVRWHHPQRNFIPPALFIPLAEETGLILQLGQWVLESACKQLVEWEGNPETSHLTLAVNVSARQFAQPNFVEQILEIVARTGANPNRLKLELTESILLADVEHTIEKMNALKARGIGFALDDFGTGYSSLSYLKRLPLDQLKIDASFIKDVLTDANDAAIARTIVGLGQTLGLDVIAEGVETQNQCDFLAENGCHAFQGYLFSRPAPAEHF